MARRRLAPWGSSGAIAVSVALAVVGVGCDDDAEPADTTVGIANPASVYCVEQGGEVEIVEEPDGQRGDCVFPDGRRVDEWELYRSRPDTTTP